MRAGGPIYSIVVLGLGEDAATEVTSVLGKRPVTFVGDSNALAYVPPGGSGFTHLAPSGASWKGASKTYLAEVVPEFLATSPDARWVFLVGREMVDAGAYRGCVWSVDLTIGATARLELFPADLEAGRAAVSRNGRRLFAVVQSGTSLAVRKWDLNGQHWEASGQGTLLAEGRLGEIACSIDGSRLVIAGSAPPRLLTAPDLSNAKSLTFSHSGFASPGFTGPEGNLTLFTRGSQAAERGHVVVLAPTKDDEDPSQRERVALATTVSDPANDSDGDETLIFPFSNAATRPTTAAAKRTINVQDELRRKLPGSLIREGDFDHSFPELAVVTKNYRELPIKQVGEVLKSEIARSGDTVEAFGIKVPAQALRQWGTMILIGIQLYLSRHFLHLRRAHAPGIRSVKSAWIGLYEDWISKIGTMLTATVFPVFACAMLFFQGTFAEWRHGRVTVGGLLFGAAGFVVSVLLGAITVRQVTGLWSDLKADELRQDVSIIAVPDP
jgi:hypothetical protein